MKTNSFNVTLDSARDLSANAGPGNRHSLLTKLVRGAAIVAVTVTALLLTYAFLIRPWQMRWGATDAEVGMLLPGDNLIPDAQAENQITRSITVDAPPEAVWPWLVQMGQSTGGLYSYELLENLLGCQMTNADRIHPEWQNTRIGDNVGMYPEGSGPPPFRVAYMLTDKAFVIGHPMGDTAAALTTQTKWNDTWAFVLEPFGTAGTRLIARTRYAVDAELGPDDPIMRMVEPGEFLMNRGMLWGIKERAERAVGLQVNHTAWEGLGAAFVLTTLVALAAVGLSRRWPLKLGLIAAGATLWWLVLFFGHPSAWLAGLLSLATLVMLVWSLSPVEPSDARIAMFSRPTEYRNRRSLILPLYSGGRAFLGRAGREEK